MTSLTSLPVLSLRDADDPVERSAFLDALCTATHETGFFYLTGHGVSVGQTRELLATAKAFFALPEAQKSALDMRRSPHFRGWTRLGGERTRGRADRREQLDVGPERPAVATPVDPWDVLEGPNQWPAALPSLRRVVTEWADTLSGVARRLLAAWAEALGQPADVFDPLFADRPSTLVKLIRYPGVDHPEQGVGAHKDPGVLTLLWIEPGRGGLQVEADGGWIDVPPVDGALVVNIGELLEVATAGYLKATVHRVLSPPAGEERVSVPFFYNPALSATVPRLHLPAGLATAARGVTVDPANPLHDTYGANLLKSRLRAHPDVAAAHHPDLVAGR